MSRDWTDDEQTFERLPGRRGRSPAAEQQRRRAVKAKRRARRQAERLAQLGLSR